MFADRRVISFLGLTLFYFLLDQFTKYIARNLLAYQSFDFGLVRFDLVFNTGAAYGLFASQTTFLLVLGFFAILYLLYNVRQFVKNRFEFLAYSFLLAGALGNTLDRLIFGKVTDFINIHIIPVFNIADICLNFGIILIIYHWFFYDRKQLD